MRIATVSPAQNPPRNGVQTVPYNVPQNAPAHISALGITCGIGAGALWGLVFLAPLLVPGFSALELTIGRYVAYGLASLLLIAPRWKAIQAAIGRKEWIALGWLSLSGNILYYILLSTAVQQGGIALTSLVIGFLPVAVTIIGSRDSGAVPLRKLTMSLLFCAAGALAIGWQAVAAPTSGALVGLLCAIGALASWTVYGVGNSRWLARTDTISAHDWSLLTGVVTGAQSIMLIPIAWMIGSTAHSPTEWGHFIAVSLGLALIASIAGGALWNRMSRLLPLTMVGQMILFETLFALLYGFAWEQRLPTILEAAAFLALTLSVVTCIAAHRKPVEAQRTAP